MNRSSPDPLWLQLDLFYARTCRNGNALMLRAVAIQGDGLAACCCARLLLNRGIPVHVEKTSRPNLPSLLVSSSTQRLIADVFADDSLFAAFPVITKRIVLWRNQATPVVLPHSGAVVPESLLLQQLWSKLEVPSTPPFRVSQDGDWLITSSRKSTGGDTLHFGARMATACAVELKAGTDASACWMEAVPNGWLFLLPTSPDRASLISVGLPVEELMNESRLVVTQMSSILTGNSSFAAYPRILDPLCAPGWLACGTSAMAFDPICGEGAGNAIREAILLSAALGFIANHSDPHTVLEHYSSRLLGGFLKHLYLCRDFYSAGSQIHWWQSELSLLEQGIQWTEQKLRATSTPQFRLVGFDLHRVA